VLARLLDSGARCVAVDLAPAGTRLRQLVPAERLAEVEVVAGDIVEDGLVERVVREHAVSRIIHLAALQIPLVASAPARGAEVNVVGTVRVFEAAAAARDQVKGLAYASSAAVFGETGALEPATLYGVFKIARKPPAYSRRRTGSVQSAYGRGPFSARGVIIMASRRPRRTR
jgi:nucleoside-diphosphate-sugar epimerase